MTTLIEGFMPAFSLHQIDHVAVAADPVAAWSLVRGFDFFSIGWAKALFRLRTVPERLAARWRQQPAPPERTGRIEDITADTGFIVLGEQPGREVVVGSVGKFWQPSIPFAKVPPDAFAAFAEPGFGKLAWSLRVDPREDGGSWITFELRVGATDPASWSRFQRYWRIIGRFSHSMRRALLHAYAKNLGGGAGLDQGRRLPGDELLPAAEAQRTHAVTIEAPPGRLWPWLVQMGCQRAGFYSLDRLDNAGVPSADRIIPELQHIAVGDVIPARPTGKEGFSVLQVVPERLLVLGSPQIGGGSAESWKVPFLMTWAFVLDPIGDSATRLIVRVRGAYQADRRIRGRVAAAVGLSQHEIMQRVQLRGLKRRAEGVTSPRA